MIRISPTFPCYFQLFQIYQTMYVNRFVSFGYANISRRNAWHSWWLWFIDRTCRISGKLKNSLFSFGAVLIGNEVYIVGGVENNAHTNEVYTMCIQTRKTTSKASMHAERSQFALAMTRDCLYAIGGRNCNDGILRTVERYCIAEVRNSSTSSYF